MMKAGASFRDKNRIKKLHIAGRTPEQISAITSVKPQHVDAIIAQVNAGTLVLSGTMRGKVGAAAGSSGGTSGGSYGEGEEDTALPNIEQGAAEKIVEDAKDDEIKDLQAQLEVAKETIVDQETLLEEATNGDNDGEASPEEASEDSQAEDEAQAQVEA